ncbi:uncharacterized protein EDB91DRAFT_1108676 [Suillus paluster]|uniref:uncharacterized protein n=1 Tax=Suillus paluster TaxID=48578 RepID=UPI001B87DD37|nr:uncharacterized protein EDB91DRAFT_1108676 [Suillus paluster]KAG1749608.1 hypothetical protein EDB91DRAFT_1108676 [Suillus paluster]
MWLTPAGRIIFDVVERPYQSGSAAWTRSGLYYLRQTDRGDYTSIRKRFNTCA